MLSGLVGLSFLLAKQTAKKKFQGIYRSNWLWDARSHHVLNDADVFAAKVSRRFPSTNRTGCVIPMKAEMDDQPYPWGMTTPQNGDIAADTRQNLSQQHYPYSSNRLPPPCSMVISARLAISRIMSIYGNYSHFRSDGQENPSGPITGTPPKKNWRILSVARRSRRN